MYYRIFGYTIRAGKHNSDDTLMADAGKKQMLLGGSGNDSIYGNTGTQYLQGGTGNDYLCDETGTDTYQNVYFGN